ncbi:3-oxoadipyl-CoA thiolase [Methylobacterium aquaticum]|uniref:3-oxoadipyl-CoA thiolase n=1 Tax=Methylobacterium aquaticum TaxID=270351 RepID=A0A0J6T4P8_9HYPH|nr:3-oxoadipyl-CoA thiolase [Methylobacterium aquaticum]KMO40919.1 beta-ketoadipyl CoA thiolase [Methylobacterium aquaticum]
MSHAYICDFARTPIGRYGGALKDVRADDLAAHPIRVLKERNPGIDWEAVDDVVLGCANQAGEDNRDVARMAALLAGLPVSAPGTTVNRLCGSGLDAVGIAARAIMTGDADLVLAGGVESMTRAPFVMGKATEAFSRQAEVFDTTIGWRFVNPLMKAQYGIDSMPETGENVAEAFGISRQDQDLFALRSQRRAAAAEAAGFFAREIAPLEVKGKKGALVRVERDEHPRPDTTLEQLAALKTPFRREGGTVTAGNASGVNDGAAALIVASEAAIRKYGLTPRARVVSVVQAGVAPRIMGIGPAPATRKLLARTGLTLGELDLVELNEAFASQALAVLRDLGLPDDAEHVNPHGGGIALGHPLGMSGARLAMTAVSALEVRGARRAVVTMCIGVGQGIAGLIERV